jgi:hypothetical protein
MVTDQYKAFLVPDSCRAIGKKQQHHKYWCDSGCHRKRLELLFWDNLAIILDFLTLQVCRINIVGSNKNLFALVAKQPRKACQRLAFLPFSKAHTYQFYIFWQCTYCIYVYSSQMTKKIHCIKLMNSYAYR